MSGSGDERVGNSAADDQVIDDTGQRIEHVELGGYFRSTHDCHQRPRRIIERLAERLEFRHQQRAGARDGCVFRNAVGARLCTMCRAESIHDEYIA